MKQTGGAKGAPIISVREGVVAPLLSHVSRVVLTWVMLFFNGRGVLPTQNKEKLQGVNLLKLFSHFYVHSKFFPFFCKEVMG